MTESIRVCRGTNQTPKLDDGGRGCATPDAATPALCVDANFTIAVSVPGRERRARVARRGVPTLSRTMLTGRAATTRRDDVRKDDGDTSRREGQILLGRNRDGQIDRQTDRQADGQREKQRRLCRGVNLTGTIFKRELLYDQTL